jgi:hypothetical protein
MQGSGVGIDEQLVRVTAMTPSGFVGPMHAQAVQYPGLQVRDVPMEHAPHSFMQIKALELAAWIVGTIQTHLDTRCHARIHGEIDASSVKVGASRIRPARSNFSHMRKS